MARPSAAHRTKRRRFIAAAIAVALLASGVGVVWALRDDEAPAAAGPTAITETPAALDGGWYADSVGPWYLDRARHTYVELAEGMSRAPAGDRILTRDGDGVIELNTVSATAPVTVRDPRLRGGDLAWSPSGDRLVGMISQKEPGDRMGFGTVDAATGAVTAHWIDHSAYNCSQCSFSWSRDGREVVVEIADRSRGEGMDRVAALQFFDAATGRPTRTVKVKALPGGPFSWSPDGRFVIAADPLNGIQLWDVAKGTATPFPYDAVWVADDLLLAPQENGTVLTVRPDGTVVHRAEVDGLFRGQRTVTVAPPG